MKKTIVYLLAITLMLLNSAYSMDLQNNTNEFSFVSNFYKILYNYDKNAVQFAENGCKIENKQDLINLFEIQKKSLNETEEMLLSLEPTDGYTQAFKVILKGLKQQREYLDNICRKMKSGSSFDLAFKEYNFLFFSARDSIKEGFGILESKMSSYNPIYQFKILASVGISEEELIEDMKKSEKIQQIQDIKN